MASSDIEVAVIGGGAAGIAAARRLADAKIQALLIEARPRLGGRAWSFPDPSGHILDLGCGWLHSADRNPWAEIAQAQGRTIDKTTPPWTRPSLEVGFARTEQREYLQAQHVMWERLAAAEHAEDRPASDVLTPNSRWNALLDAVMTYISGAELDRVSAIDLARYDDDGVNWRVIEGYGTTVAAAGAGIDVALECPVRRIDHGGRKLRIETAKGVITAEQAIVALPTSILADTPELFSPVLPEKTDAAAGLPLGLADKLFVALDNPEEFARDSRLFGATDRTATAIYHLRPFGRPMIEAYFGGANAWALEADSDAAFFDFATSELVNLLGSNFARRIKPIAIHRWGHDPLTRGSYSYARPGKADMRAALAAPVNERLYFAGEASSRGDFSTAHGAYLTGVAAAEQVIAVREAVKTR